MVIYICDKFKWSKFSKNPSSKKELLKTEAVYLYILPNKVLAVVIFIK